MTEEADLCATCAHMVSVVDRRYSRHVLRVLTVCAYDHDADGTDGADHITEPIAECPRYRRWEE